MKRPKQNSTFTFTDKPEKLSTHCLIELNGKLNVFIYTTLYLQSTEVYFMPVLPDRKQIVINGRNGTKETEPQLQPANIDKLFLGLHPELVVFD